MSDDVTPPARGPAKKITMHFLVPVAKAPAPHMVSGEPPGLRTLAEALKTPIGHQGQAFAPACDPRRPLDEAHRGTGEAYALLAVVNGEPVIPESACPQCLDSDAWKDAFAKSGGHPLAAKPQQIGGDGCCG